MSKPRNSAQLAKLMIDIASGEVEDRDLSRQPLRRRMSRHLEPQRSPPAAFPRADVDGLFGR
jgi:hypothetical protein